MEPMPFAVLDVFTDRPLAGNQLAVFLDGGAIPEALLQPLARETNFSETVFVYPPERGGDARIRIFTPAHELPFAGHPVLGTAILLAQQRGLALVTLETQRADVPVAVEERTGTASFGWMRQPLPLMQPFAAVEPLLAALGVERSMLPVDLYDNGVSHVFVTLATPSDVMALRPDPNALAAIQRNVGDPRLGINCFAGDRRNWTTRMFSPADGIREDPATGSAAGSLVWHLVRHGRISLGDEVEIAQGDAVGRPSTLFARTRGEGEHLDAVEVGGSAVLVARGDFAW